MTKYAGRTPAVESPAHKIVTNDFFRTTEFCGNCHNEKNPFGVWVKSTQLEMEGGSLFEGGCEMPGLSHAKGRSISERVNGKTL